MPSGISGGALVRTRFTGQDRLVEATHDSTLWDRVLLVVVVGVAFYALGLVFAGWFIGEQVFDRLGFGPDDGDILDERSRDYVRMIYGILGAVIVGWMATIGALVIGPLRRREAWAWWVVAGSMTSWFVLDTGISLATGFVGHALFNVAFAIALGLPLTGIHREL